MQERRLSRREFLKGASATAALYLLSQFFPERSKNKNRIKTPTEIEAERAVAGAYSSYLSRTFIDNHNLLFRVPFAEADERFAGQNIFFGGKGDPDSIWDNTVCFRKYSALWSF